MSAAPRYSPFLDTNTLHLWQGRWITDIELGEKIKRLPDDINCALALPFELRFVLDACDKLSAELRSRTSKTYVSLAKCLREGYQLSQPEVTESLEELADFLSRKSLEEKIRREMGTHDPFTFARSQYRSDVFEKWAPLGFLLHIAPTNAYSVGALSVVEGLLTGNVNFLKTGGSDELFAQLFLDSLIGMDKTATIAPRIFACRISSRDEQLLKEIIGRADGIAAWGAEGAIEGVRALAAPLARFIDWGPKISFGYFASDKLDDQESVAALARECCLLEQQACSSPQCVYVETEQASVLTEFAHRLASSVAVVSPTVPSQGKRKEPDLSEQAEITSVVELCRLESCLGLSEVLEAADGSWHVLLEHASTLRASPLFRTIWVKPIKRTQIIQTLRPFRGYLQTVGLACTRESMTEISNALVQSGVLRITRPGGMLASYSGEPHDGVYALQRYSRRISAQPGADLAGISSLDELNSTSQQPPDAPILTKEQFQAATVAPEHSQLFFKSGGTTGAAKMSIFSYDDYHLQMSAAADGLYAAGLDPERDRCMNLFFGGGLYGGFISFFTILEMLEAVQFPMMAHADTRMVAEMIVEQRINVLLAMPSYITQLFGENADLLRKHRVVEKIFYGGEHFNDTQKRYFENEFGIKIIRSATYGSVDAGPIGFQCVFSTGSVHHLHSRLHTLEILDMEKDAPAATGERGRVVLTSLNRSGQRIERYDIGDLARLLPDNCPCGRRTPRFELLGRHGDVFKVGSAFFNYRKFVEILTEQMEYAGELQIVLRPGDKTSAEALCLCLSPVDSLDEAQIRDIVLKHYADVREVVLTDRVLELQVECFSPDLLRRTAGSGKLLRIVDERNLSRQP